MPNGNDRGSSYDRRARRAWLLSPKAGFGGDGVKVPCWECGAMVSDKTIHVDRIIPAHQGGRYIRSNIRPHCPTCSHREGQRVKCELARLASPYGDDDLCRACGAHWLAKHAADCANLIAGLV
ncbi:HNH endonuclease [Mycobacterium phage 39HC]|uniref:HNH endonuclease n=1 Tax=Mycobacterium phage 39HC TaxID=1463809 RepID=UPI0003F20A4B|nr:HNH endonuclease [Mycobacterium phage 39HC]AHJ88375.1 HNH endonuclease [Mycobacterium phage 39HC]AHJ88475.1 HNH endonuclease [Mycobacterium phage 40BC]